MNIDSDINKQQIKPDWSKPLIKDYGYINELTQGGLGTNPEGVGGSFDNL